MGCADAEYGLLGKGVKSGTGMTMWEEKEIFCFALAPALSPLAW
jgi:hypothetical protein